MPRKLEIGEEKLFLKTFLDELINDGILNPKVGFVKKNDAILKFNAYCRRNSVVPSKSLGTLLERNHFLPSTRTPNKPRSDFAITTNNLPTILNQSKAYNEKYFVNSFLAQMYNKKIMDSRGLIFRSNAVSEFNVYCSYHNVIFKNHLGNILERNGFFRTYQKNEMRLKNVNKTIDHYEIDLRKLNLNGCLTNGYHLEKSKPINNLNEINNGRSEETIFYSNGINEEEEVSEIMGPEKLTYDESTEYDLVYWRTFNQNINEDYSPTIMSCMICQENFQTKIDFDIHLKDNHIADLNKNYDKNNKEDLDSSADSEATSYFKISYYASTTTYYLKFKLIYLVKNVSVLNIYTIKAGKFIEISYLDKEPYFYVDQHLFPIGIKQPIFIIFKESNVRKIEEHHFLIFDQLPGVVKIQLQSKNVLRRAELPFKTLAQNLPKPPFALYCNRGYCDEDLKAISPEFREYIENPSSQLMPNNFISVLTNLLAMEDQHIINQYNKFALDNVMIHGTRAGYFISVNYPHEYKIEEVIRPYDDMIIKLPGEEPEIIDGKEKKNNEHRGLIWTVKKTSITFQCNDQLTGQKAKISFLPCRFTLRYQYCALSFISPELKHILFPVINFHANKVAYVSLNIYDESIKNNPEQLQAVMNIVDPANKEIPYIIFGPPGTGKTTTVVESVFQLIRSSQSNKILVASGSNAACDEIAKRLTKILNYTNPEELAVLRIFSAAAEQRHEDLSKTEPLLFQASNHVYGDHFYPSLDTIKEYRVIICTLAVVGRYVLGGLKPGFFSHVFIDEAAASTEPEALVGISKVLSPTSHLILSGDTKQLGAVLFSNRAKELGLGKSLMERLLERKCYKSEPDGKYDKSIQTRLVRNFRTHESIICLSNYLYYNNELIPSARKELTDWAIGWQKLPNKKIPIIFHNVQGSCLVASGETSSYNLEERDIVVQYVRNMLRSGINDRQINESDIGIISPYKKQYTLIKENLCQFNIRSIETGSVEIFQGKEKPIIIISMVKSFKFVGFLNEDKRINVMLSRPQALLIIIGNADTLKEIPAFNYVIEYCKDNNAFIDENEIKGLNQQFQRINLSKK